MRTVIMGMGMVGTALAKVLQANSMRSNLEVIPRDVQDGHSGATPVDVLNICFPYSVKFKLAVMGYTWLYSPSLVIIHSTVPVGTTRTISEAANHGITDLIAANAPEVTSSATEGQDFRPVAFVHSPVNGIHDLLEEALLAFPKPIGAIDVVGRKLATEFFYKGGMHSVAFPSPEHTELAKLFCTLRYGLDIMFQKQVYEECEKRGLDPEQVYTRWTVFYNEGYEQMKLQRFHRSILAPMSGKIGGTCVIPNARLLPGFKPAQKLLDFNEALD